MQVVQKSTFSKKTTILILDFNSFVESEYMSRCDFAKIALFAKTASNPAWYMRQLSELHFSRTQNYFPWRLIFFHEQVSIKVRFFVFHDTFSMKSGVFHDYFSMTRDVFHDYKFPWMPNQVSMIQVSIQNECFPYAVWQVSMIFVAFSMIGDTKFSKLSIFLKKRIKISFATSGKLSTKELMTRRYGARVFIQSQYHAHQVCLTLP